MNRIILGNSNNVLAEFEDNSIDTIITDPPYGLALKGLHWDYDVPSVKFWRKALRVLKPGGTALVFAGSRTYHVMATRMEEAGFVLKDCIMWLYGSGLPKGQKINKLIERRGKDGKQWEGWNSHSLKPAYEPIIVAMKPNEGTYADNAENHGVSGLNFDECRIPVADDDVNRRPNRDDSRYTDHETEMYSGVISCPDDVNRDGLHNKKGRVPTNIIIDEEVSEMLNEQTKDMYCGGKKRTRKPKIRRTRVSAWDPNGGFVRVPKEPTISPGGHEVGGGASRFFYTPKPSKKEKGPAAKHPTVKPLALMEYLCKLTKTPTGGTVLDPFAGSGTTALACQNTGRPYIMIEQDVAYFDIMIQRTSENKEKNDG